MLFFLRRSIESLVLPIGISVLLALAGTLLRRRWMAALGAGVLYVFSTPLAGGLMIHSLERFYPPVPFDVSPHVDAIVVLSGGIVRGTNAHGVQWGDSANRYFAGLDLALAGKADRLILSAGYQNPGEGSQGQILERIARDRGVPADHIIVTPPVFTTEDEARAVSNVPDVHSVLLVTSAFHMPRAVLLFRSQGLDVTPFPTDQRVLRPQAVNSFDFIPDSASLWESEQAIREYEGLIVYRTLLLFHFNPSRH